MYIRELRGAGRWILLPLEGASLGVLPPFPVFLLSQANRLLALAPAARQDSSNSAILLDWRSVQPKE